MSAALPYRTHLSMAVAAVLAAAISGVPVVRGRRSEVSREERPLICVATGDMPVAYDDDVVIGHVRLEPEVIISAYPSPATQDVGLEDTLALMEARICEALQGQRLLSPGGVELTDRLELLSAEIQHYDAESSAPRMGEVQVTFRARGLLPQGVFRF